MRIRWSLLGVIVLAALPIVAHGDQATPTAEATPIATPVVFTGCADLDAYFATMANLVNGNTGYLAVRSNPDGVFQVNSVEARDRVASLDDLLAAFDAIAPPSGAMAWHTAFTDIVAWYRDLAASPDMTTFQRVVNRDKVLIPALSRAAIAGQAACGVDAWQTAYDAAFGGR